MAAPSDAVTHALVISADLTAIGVQSGCLAATSAARPATWGAAIDVPEL
jgi:hypothetical protein